MSEEKQKPPFVPNAKEAETQKMVFGDLNDCRKVRDKKYRLLGDRTMQRYWDEQEKRFVTYVPPKDVSEDDWQANIVMGITRNAVLSQISKTGMRVPEARIQSFKDGLIDDERSRIYQNLYRASLRRENADQLQQYVSLGTFMRGNTVVYEGFEDKEIEVEIVEDTDAETGEVKTKTDKIRRWGPKRQIVPIHEFYYPNIFANDVQEQSKCLWVQDIPLAAAEAEFGKCKNWKYVSAGNYSVGNVGDSFFYSRGQLSGKNVQVIRWYGNPFKGGKDRHVVLVQGIPMLDIPLPFNHKKLPFGWGRNNPFSDKFMLGMGVPFMAMDHQDSADAVLNMMLDKNTLSSLRPVMTDDPDPSVRSYLSPGGLLQFTKGSKYELAPLEGVTQSEFNVFQEVVRQAKEFSGAFGGAGGATPRGGKLTARQLTMMEEETKRLLGISMSNLESLERDLSVQRVPNIIQFAPGSGMRMETTGAALPGGRKGRFVAIFAENLKKAQSLEMEDKQLSQIELAGEAAGVPTEAVAIAPDWFDMNDRIESEVVQESSYLRTKSLEQAMASEDYTLLAQNPLVNQEENLREFLKSRNKDPEKLINKQPPAPPPGQEPPGQPQPPGPGSLTGQLAAPSKSLNALT